MKGIKVKNMPPKFNVIILEKNLIAEGIPIYGCSSNGRIDFKDEATEEQKKLAEIIKANHSPYDYRRLRVKDYPPLGDQLDHLYKALSELKAQGTWNGIDEWFTKIDKVKKTWPKDKAPDGWVWDGDL